MSVVPLQDAGDPDLFGGKATQLGAALRAGLPVPDGWAISAEMVAAVVRGDAGSCASIGRIMEGLHGPLAVRSSAIGEDSDEASFAGQHATKLNVNGCGPVFAAITEVWQSGHTATACAYRRRMGASSDAKVAVVVQKLVQADVAGVLFTCNPVTGADEIVIEAGWGLGECVVQGLVVPDRFRMTRDGAILERTAGEKTIAIRNAARGGTCHEQVAPHLARRFCLSYPDLRTLHQLAMRCDDVFGAEPHDLEWAFEDGRLFLLQRRPVTRTGRPASP